MTEIFLGKQSNELELGLKTKPACATKDKFLEISKYMPRKKDA